jgi:hypothetical protein
VLVTASEPKVAGNMMLDLFAFAFCIPVYRPQCLLGFVLGITYTFGAVLPTVIGIFLGLVGLVLHAYLRRGLVYAGSKCMLLNR